MGLVLVLVALLGCLRAFGPDLRPTGSHAAMGSTSDSDACMSCHESEAEALARIQAHGHAHGMSEVPLVPDWMVTDERSCVACHVVRGADAR